MITKDQKTEILRFITSNYGTRVKTEQWQDIEDKIKSTCNELHIRDWESFAKRIPDFNPNCKEMETLACYFSVGETYFFRETNALDLFTTKILPYLMEENAATRSINIWSAGCCSGEEPYTLAILLREHVKDIEKWHINILATDINQHFLNKAKAGKYTSWSFRNTPKWVKSKYFMPEDKAFRICDSIRNMVSFKQINLVDSAMFPSVDIMPKSIDVIFCRNVFIYFPGEIIKDVATRFNTCLKDNGWLITSAVEVLSEGLSVFQYQSFPGIGVLRNNAVSNAKTQAQDSREKVNGCTYNPGSAKMKTAIEQKDSIANCLNNANNFFKGSIYKEALRELKIVLEKYPDHAEALNLKARIHANLGDHGKAIHLLSGLVERDGNDAFSYYLLASMYMETEQHDLSEQNLRRALYLNPGMISAQFLMGNLMQTKGNVEASQKYFINLKAMLNQYEKSIQLPELDGMTTGALSEIVNSLVS